MKTTVPAKGGLPRVWLTPTDGADTSGDGVGAAFLAARSTASKFNTSDAYSLFEDQPRCEPALLTLADEAVKAESAEAQNPTGEFQH